MHLLLASNHLDALFITNPINVEYLTNFKGSRKSLLILPKKTYLFTDFRYLNEARKNKNITVIDITRGFEKPWQTLLKKHRLQKIGFEEQNLTVFRFKQLRKKSRLKNSTIHPKLIPTHHLIENLRAIKTPTEILKIKKAQAITDKTFLLIKNFIHKKLRSKQSITEKQIASQIETLAEKLGATMAFPPIVAFGAHSATPHHQNSSTKLKKGQLILIDMGAKYQNYCSDMTRVLFTKPPTTFQEKIYNLVLKAQKKVISNLKANQKCAAYEKMTVEHFKKAGYGDYFQHSVGHGLGLEIHEIPSLSKENKETKHLNPQKLLPNMITTVEPGLYFNRQFGIRIEDLIWIKQNGIQNLTKSSKKTEDNLLKI